MPAQNILTGKPGGDPDLPAAFGACPGCDLLLRIPAVPDGHYLACRRCGTTISKSYRNSIGRVLALSFAGLMLYIPALFLPLMTLSTIGMTEQGSVIDTVVSFARNGYFLVALMVFGTAVIFPLLKLALPFSISLCLQLGKRPAWLKPAFRLLLHLNDWGMIDVYLLGILVSLIKIGGMASITFEAGFFSFIGLVVLSMATIACRDNQLFWYEIDHHADPAAAERLSPLLNTAGRTLTAAQAGMMRCPDCALLVAAPGHKQNKTICPRCQAAVSLRKKGSVDRTWALIITSFILFIPANTLPIMRVDFLGIPQRSTILDGIIFFFEDGSYAIGLIIFTASILVPLFKIIGLLIILWTIRSADNRFLRQKTGMFRFIEFIGRWSMLDIFVIALLTVLLDFSFLTSIHTAPAATYFSLVVACTMAAAIVFDPRIMWDRCAPPTDSV